MNLDFIKKTVLEELKPLLTDAVRDNLKSNDVDHLFQAVVSFTSTIKSFLVPTNDRQAAARKVLGYFHGGSPVEPEGHHASSEAGLTRSLFRLAVRRYAKTLPPEEARSFLEESQL